MNSEFKTDSVTGTSTKHKRDFILIAAFLCAAIIIYAFLYFTSSEGSIEFTVSGYQGGINSIIISNGSVTVSDADCPDKLCVKTGKINRAGETIVCLPHRVVVEIKRNSVSDNDNIDSVVQ